MKIDGRELASLIKGNQQKTIDLLRNSGVTPSLSVVYVGNDLSSQAYIRQKELYGTSIGIKVTIDRFSESTDPDRLLSHINTLNLNPEIHGVIIQRPVPLQLSQDALDVSVIPQKDVDGFHPQSQFQPPVALAVLKILEYIHIGLLSKKILVIGRGESGGKPIAETFAKMNIPVTIANSKTENIKKLALECDIIVSCVGKPNIVRHQMVSSKTVLIGVGLHGENGKLRADYNEEEIKDRVAFYTPVPGGVGPVNVACLFENVIKAAEQSIL